LYSRERKPLIAATQNKGTKNCDWLKWKNKYRQIPFS